MGWTQQLVAAGAGFLPYVLALLVAAGWASHLKCLDQTSEAEPRNTPTPKTTLQLKAKCWTLEQFGLWIFRAGVLDTCEALGS